MDNNQLLETAQKQLNIPAFVMLSDEKLNASNSLH